MNANLAASIRARLLNLAKERGEDFNLTLNRYAVERCLIYTRLAYIRNLRIIAP